MTTGWNLCRAVLGMAAVMTTSLAAALAPRFSFSSSYVPFEVIEVGEPWRIAIRIEASERDAATLLLAPAGRAWTEAVAVELVAVGRDVVVATALPLGPPVDPAATVGAGRIAGGLWRFAPEAMEKVSPGEYRLRARLIIPDGPGWSGEARTEEVPVKIVNRLPDAPSRRVINRGYDALVCGETREAAEVLDVALREAPDDLDFLVARARIAERAGNHLAAQLCLTAIALLEADQPAGHPDAELADLLRRIGEGRRESGTSSLQAWSWPPEEVIAMIHASARKSGLIVPQPEDVGRTAIP